MTSEKTKIIQISHNDEFVYLVSFSMKGEIVSVKNVEEAPRFTRQGAYSLCTRITGHGEFAIPSDSPEQKIVEAKRREEMNARFAANRLKREQGE